MSGEASNRRPKRYFLISGANNGENKGTCRTLPKILALDRLCSIGTHTGDADLLFLPDCMVGSFQSGVDQLHAATIVRFAGKESQSEVAA